MSDDIESPHLSQDTRTSSSLALMVFDHLGLFAFLPILKSYKNLVPIQIYYVRASGFGLKIIRVLRIFGIVRNYCQIKDYVKIDTQQAIFYKGYFIASKICHSKQNEIEQAVVAFFPRLSKYSIDLLVLGVRNDWIYRVTDLMWLQAFTEQLAKELNTSLERVVVVSAYANLFSKLQSGSPYSLSPVTVISQPFQNCISPRVIQSICWSIYRVLRNFFFRFIDFGASGEGSLNKNGQLSKVAFFAARGIKTERELSNLFDDLVWWEGSGIPSNRLVYIYDRPDYTPTEEKIQLTNSMGIPSFVLDRRNAGDFSELALEKFFRRPFLVSLKEVGQVLRWSFRALFKDAFSQAIIAQGISHLVAANWIATYLKALKVKGLVHYQEASADWHSLAAELVDGCRFGTIKSFLPSLADVSITTHVFFSWSEHDAQVLMDTGGISKHLLIAGCPLEPPREEDRGKYLALVDEVRNCGANYVLALFDSSWVSRDFYSFFLGWLLKDPKLGLIIKSKKATWSEIQADGLSDLGQMAMKTGRLKVVEKKTSPANIATVVDFSIGIGSVSATVFSAIHGARVLFVDFEHLDQAPFRRPTFPLHSLGPNRCIFYDFNSVKKAVLEYINNPESNPNLGDASPVLDLLDPFRDGKGAQRIGEYMGWYMEGRDEGFSRDDALCCATKKYAEKWGEDKVVRGLVMTEK
tara:strand:+ start:528 stop:2606 length:2079 start_codon:yes stop_codon:yes gene_type:complete